MSTSADRQHDPKDLSLEAARWLRAARAAHQSDAAPTLVPEPLHEDEQAWSSFPIHETLEGEGAIRRPRARQSRQPSTMAAAPFRLRGRSPIAAAARLIIVIAVAALSALIALGQFPSLEAWRAPLGDALERAASSSRPAPMASAAERATTTPVPIAQLSHQDVADPAPLAAAPANSTEPAAPSEPRRAERPLQAADGSGRRRLDADEIASLRQHGKDFFRLGDVAAARLLLQRAAEAQDAESALALAATYDPFELRQLKVYGLAGDLAVARGWYEKAREYGSTEAPRWLERLVDAR